MRYITCNKSPLDGEEIFLSKVHPHVLSTFGLHRYKHVIFLASIGNGYKVQKIFKEKLSGSTEILTYGNLSGLEPRSPGS